VGRFSLIQIYILITVVHFVFVLVLFLTVNKRGDVWKTERWGICVDVAQWKSEL